MASAASGAAIFVEQDAEAPDKILERARALTKTLEAFISDILREETERYGERFLSGPKKRPLDTASREASLFTCDLRDAMSEVARLS